VDVNVLMITQKVDLDDDVLGFTHTWVNKLAELVSWLHVLALSVGRHELTGNVTLYSMGKEQGAGRLRRFVNFNRIVAPLVLRCQVDLVFVHMAPLYAILAAPWTKLARVPIVLWYAHGYVSHKLRVAHWLVDRVVSSTPEGFRLPSEKLVVVGQGIDTGVFKPVEGPWPKRPLTVLSVGRISPVKDYETLIAAADILVNRRGAMQPPKFVIVGDVGTPRQRTYRDKLLTQVQGRGLSEFVRFVGSVPHDQIFQYYQMADLFVSTSQTGSLDKAVLEAMACGVPVLTCNEAFGDFLSGLSLRLMFGTGAREELANRLSDVLNLGNDDRRSLGSELRYRVVSEHSLAGLADRLATVFREITR
jgi:glycosyltransferase involved in cell wall biosynthesis